jgi:hypothetical protein
MPELYANRPPEQQLIVAVAVPTVFGIICGVLLGISEAAYLVLSILAIAGGFGAGLEHRDAAEGAARGAIGGSLFGGFILATHELSGADAKADLPDPAILLMVLTVGFGVLLGAWGGRVRAKRIARAA